jgi:hypothetical protein
LPTIVIFFFHVVAVKKAMAIYHCLFFVGVLAKKAMITGHHLFFYWCCYKEGEGNKLLPSLFFSYLFVGILL